MGCCSVFVCFWVCLAGFAWLYCFAFDFGLCDVLGCLLGVCGLRWFWLCFGFVGLV